MKKKNKAAEPWYAGHEEEYGLTWNVSDEAEWWYESMEKKHGAMTDEERSRWYKTEEGEIFLDVLYSLWCDDLDQIIQRQYEEAIRVGCYRKAGWFGRILHRVLRWARQQRQLREERRSCRRQKSAAGEW